MNSSKVVRAVAEGLRAAKPEPTWCANKHAQHRVCINRIADALARASPAFDRAAFADACGDAALANIIRGDRA